jgi:hypothetical protein
MAIGVAVLLLGAVVSWAWAPETRHLALSESSGGAGLGGGPMPGDPTSAGAPTPVAEA